MELNTITYSSVSLAAVHRLARIASVSNGKNVAKELANDRDGRVAADYLSIVTAINVAGTARRGIASTAAVRSSSRNCNKGDSSKRELHVEGYQEDI